MRVVIVDDSALNLRLMDGLVNKTGNHQIHLFDQPRAALEWCRSQEPDLLIVDYMMPEMDGLSLIRAFRALPGRGELPVLMITADHDKETRYKALENGANDFLTKPIDGQEFRARVRNMLALRASQKQLAEQAAALADRNAWLKSKVDEATAGILAREQEMIIRLSRAAEFRDPETGAHILRMANYSRLIGGELGLSESEQDLILRAAPMHDVGKIAIPDYILLKPGRLTAEEMEIMKRHAEYGYELLRGSQSTLLDAAAVIAYSHHEKYDGSGYPLGLKGGDIPLHGRIVAVADVFDALTSDRPYKAAWPLDKALAFLREGAGGHFDPRCVEAFMARLDEVLVIRARYQDEALPVEPAQMQA